MFYFEIVNGGIGALSFMNHPPDPSILRNDRQEVAKSLDPK